jgi:hypothetical protein
MLPFLITGLAWAQGAPESPPTWSGLLALGINTVVVGAGVKILAAWAPWVRHRYPVLLPLITGVAGPLIAMLQNGLSSMTGAPINLSPWLAIFSGATSIAVAQVPIQYRRQKLLRGVTPVRRHPTDGAPI